MENFRRFEAVDPDGRAWQVEFRWQQNAISIRHSDSVDVKFQLIQGEDVTEKVVALRHPRSSDAQQEAGTRCHRRMGDEAGRSSHERYDRDGPDMEKTLVTTSIEDLERYSQKMMLPAPIRR